MVIPRVPGYDWTRDAMQLGVWIGWILAALHQSPISSANGGASHHIDMPDPESGPTTQPMHQSRAPENDIHIGEVGHKLDHPLRSVRSKAAKQQIMGDFRVPSLSLESPTGSGVSAYACAFPPRTFRPFWPQRVLLRTQSTCLRLYDNTIMIKLAIRPIRHQKKNKMNGRGLPYQSNDGVNPRSTKDDGAVPKTIS